MAYEQWENDDIIDRVSRAAARGCKDDDLDVTYHDWGLEVEDPHEGWVVQLQVVIVHVPKD